LFSLNSLLSTVRCSKGKYSTLILVYIPGISIPLYNLLYHCPRSTVSSSSMQVNKHHTSECTDFVLVEERVAYYNHRHSGICETNILQVIKQGEGETIKISRYCLFQNYFNVTAVSETNLFTLQHKLYGRYAEFLLVSKGYCIPLPEKPNIRIVVKLGDEKS
jgi:hypothetical protein